MTLRIAVPALALLTSPAALAEGGWPDLSQPATAAIPRPSDVAVVIGVEDYDHMLDVPGATSTAQAWHRWFEQGLGVPAENLRLLLGAEATPQAMATAVTDAALEVQPGASFWFVFIGQASPSCDGADVMMFGPEAGPEAPGFIQGGFSWASLEGLLELGSHQHSIVMIDASVNERDRSLDKLGCEMVPVMPPIQIVPSEHALLITAAGPDEFAGSLYGTEMPAFSSLMLGALRGWADGNGDGQVTGAEAAAWVDDVLAATERRLPQHPRVWGDAGPLPMVTAALPSPALPDMIYEVARFQTQTRNSELSWSPSDASGPKAPDVESDPTAQGAHDQLTGEMRHLSRRNAWKGVEQSFLDLVELAPDGVRPTAEDLGMGAQAARALGKADAVLSRLEQLQAIEPTPDTQQWLDELVRSYGAVSLRDRSGGATLTAARMPMAPDQRAAIDTAITLVAETGRFEGLLPWGVYDFGGRTLMVVPDEAVLEVVLKRR